MDPPEKPQTVEKGSRIIIFPDAADITEGRNKTEFERLLYIFFSTFPRGDRSYEKGLDCNLKVRRV